AVGPQADLLPHRACPERLAASAQEVLLQAALPQIADLARGEEPRDLPEHPVEQRASAAAQPPDVQDPHRLLGALAVPSSFGPDVDGFAGGAHRCLPAGAACLRYP